MVEKVPRGRGSPTVSVEKGVRVLSEFCKKKFLNCLTSCPRLKEDRETV